jgi:hypothetical protein
MVNDGICKRVAELKEAQSQKSELSRDQLREFLTEVIVTPAGKVDEQSKLCQSYKITAEGREIRMPDKLRAVEQLAKLCGWNEPEKLEHGTTSELTELLRKRLPAKPSTSGPNAPALLLHHIQPGKPMQNAVIESFNGTFRDDCLNQHWFGSLAEARLLIEHWRSHDYNHLRPHSSLGRIPPNFFALNSLNQTPNTAPSINPAAA